MTTMREIQAAGRAAVAEATGAVVLGVLRELVRTLPRCDAVVMWCGATSVCANPATHACGRGGARYCDVHVPTGVPEYPRAPALRRAMNLLATGDQ